MQEEYKKAFVTIDPLMRKRLEDIEEQLVMNAKLKIEDVNWLIRQVKRVEELEKENRRYEQALRESK